MPAASLVSPLTVVAAQGSSLVIPKPSLLDGDVVVLFVRSQGTVPSEMTLPEGWQRAGTGAFPAGDRAQAIAYKYVPVASDELSTSYTFEGLSTGSSRITGAYGVLRGADPDNLNDGGVRYDTDAELPPFTAGGVPYTVFGLWGGEFTAGVAPTPSSAPDGFAVDVVGQGDGPSVIDNSITAGSRTGIVVASKKVEDGSLSVPSATMTWDGSPVDVKSASWAIRGSQEDPPKPPARFDSAYQFLSTKGATALHRAPVGQAPSCIDTIMLGSSAGFSCFEMSVAFTSSNEPFLLGDRYLDPTALNAPSGTSLLPTAMSWEEISEHEIVIGANAPQPYVLLEDALAATVDAGLGIALVDPKFGAGEPPQISAMLDICDSHGGPEKIIIKFDSPITGSDLVVAAKARGYATMNYWGTEIEKLTPVYHTDLWDLIGAKYDADSEMWDAVKNIGKKTWAAIVPDQASLNAAVEHTNADFYMVQSLSITPVGPVLDVPDPSLADLEISWLRRESGISDRASLADLRRAVFGTSEYSYWAGMSGLPAGSLSDHKYSVMAAATGTSGSLADLSRLYYSSW